MLGPHTMASHLADLLDLPLASEEVPGVIESAGEPHPVPEIVRSVLAHAPETYQSHDKLVVDGVEIPWRYRDGDDPRRHPAGPSLRTGVGGRPLAGPPRAGDSADEPG